MNSFRFGFAMAVVSVLVINISGCTSLTNGATLRMQVVGYAEAGSTSPGRLDASRQLLTTVGVDGVNVERGGLGVSPISPDVLRLLSAAHQRGKRAELLVGNYDGGLDDFSARIGDDLLSSMSNMRAVAATLSDDVRRDGWDGVTVDFENLSGRYVDGLTQFVSMLKTALGLGKSVSVCLMAATGDYTQLGYKLKTLGQAADHVVLMGYDEHGPTWSGPGAVGGLPWVKTTIAPLLKAIPKSKLQLGIAGYGYTWPKTGSGMQVTDREARAIVAKDGALAHWSSIQKEWHATLTDGTVLWWSDARSFHARLSYAAALHIGGVAVWSLGLSDALVRSTGLSTTVASATGL